MNKLLLAALVGGWTVIACGGVDVPTDTDQPVIGSDDSVDETDPNVGGEEVAAQGEGDTGEDGLAGDPDLADVPEGEEDPGEQAAGTGVFPNNSSVETTANLNLRSGPSTSKSILRTMPEGSIVKVIDGVASNGFIKVQHNGLQGYAAYRYLRAAAGGSTGGGGTGGSGSSKRDNAIAVAKTGVGFSYWWGGGRWLASGATSSNSGRCTGSCPNCSHSGSYGADCSGYVAKVWQVPASNTNVATNSHPYSTADFYSGTGGGQWSSISRSSIQKGDAMVYRSGGAGHIVVFESGDAWGSPAVYEARGCSYKIARNVRSFGSSWKTIKRTGW